VALLSLSSQIQLSVSSHHGPSQDLLGFTWMIGGGIAHAIQRKYFDKTVTNGSDVDIQAALEEGEKKIA
jgi:hypothetical protein